MARRLAGLLDNLGWVHSASCADEDTSEDGEDGITDPILGRKETGITMISHSK